MGISRGAAGSPRSPERGGVWGAISGPPILIGVDVGGTTIAAGGVTPEGEVLHDENILTHDAAAVGTLVTIERLIAAVTAALASRGLTVSGIGVGAPGPVDVEAGRVGEPAPHAGDLVGQPIGARLTTRFGVPVVVDNDVNALALAEWRVGAGGGARPPAPPAPGAGGAADGITAELVFRAAADGEAVATAVVDEACRALGAMLATIVNGLNPEVVVVTGGVAASLAALEKRILAAAAEYAFARALAATRITIVPGDKRLTMRGAAALGLYERERRAG